MSEHADLPAEGPQFTAARWADTLPTIDSNEFAARAAKHLREDPVIWLTTVTPNGLPAPNPLWFIWDGEDTIRLFTMAGATRIRNLERNPRVSLNFAGDSTGVQVVVLTGTAEVDPQGPAADSFPDFVDKYAGWFPLVNQTPSKYAEQYGVPITVKLSRIRGV